MAKQAKVRWVGGMQFVAETGSGHAIILDTQPPDGRNTGPSPMELLLAGLGGCTAVDVVNILSKKRQHIRTVEVRVHGEQRQEPPNIYTDIVVEYVVYGKGVSEKAVEQAIELSETKYCSAAAMMNKVAKITTKYTIVEE
jgi:putative redox protein